MELIIFLCAFLLFISMLVKIMKENSKIKLPPGPRKLPIVGNMHQLYGRPIHHTLRDLAKKYGPLMHLKFGEVSTYIVTSPEVAKEIFQSHDILFSQRPSNNFAYEIVSYKFLDIIFSPYGTYWRQLRKIAMLELLSSKRVQTFRSIREEEVLNLMRSISLQKGSFVNLSEKIFSLTYGITARAAFGKRNKYQDKFIQLVEQINKLSAGSSIADFYPSLSFLQMISGLRHKLERAHKEVDIITGHILQEHKEEMMKPKLGDGVAKEDLVDVLLRIQKSNEFEVPLTDDSLKAVIFDIFIAGGETSSTTVEWAMAELIKNPQVLKRAQAEVRNVFGERGNVDESSLDELKYLHAVVKETLRLHLSAPLMLPRECREQCKIYGYDIPTKARVIVNGWAINRDPNYWTEAETFNPDRFLDSKIDYKGNDFHYIPFGAGRRICPGMTFAVANIMLPVAQLLFHFDWKLPGDMKPEDLDMDENTGVSVRRKNDLKLMPIPYHRSSLKN